MTPPACDSGHSGRGRPYAIKLLSASRDDPSCSPTPAPEPQGFGVFLCRDGRREPAGPGRRRQASMPQNSRAEIHSPFFCPPASASATTTSDLSSDAGGVAETEPGEAWDAQRARGGQGLVTTPRE